MLAAAVEPRARADSGARVAALATATQRAAAANAHSARVCSESVCKHFHREPSSRPRSDSAQHVLVAKKLSVTCGGESERAAGRQVTGLSSTGSAAPTAATGSGCRPLMPERELDVLARRRAVEGGFPHALSSSRVTRLMRAEQALLVSHTSRPLFVSCFSIRAHGDLHRQQVWRGRPQEAGRPSACWRILPIFAVMKRRAARGRRTLRSE